MNKSIKSTVAAIALMAGFALPSAAMATIYTNDTDVALPDQTSNASDIVIADVGSIASITVEVGMEHTWIGDLLITLTSADGTELVLMDRPGRTDSGVGDSSNLIVADPLIFDDAAGTPVEQAGAGVDSNGSAGGTYMPEESLATLLGESLAGTWTLTINDLAGGDFGLLDYWSLDIAYDAEQVSEPASLALLGFGLAGVGLARRRKV